MPRSRPLETACGRQSRREFLALSAAGFAAGAAAPAVHAAGGDGEIRVGLLGCGGRGTGATLQAAAADPAVRIVAIGDVFADQLDASAHILARDVSAQFVCPATARFVGGDAYRRVLDAGVDAVVIAAPPHLRPLHVEAAVAAGAHVFCETPAAIDPAGAMRVARALAAARAAGLSVASGFHSRRDTSLASLVADVRAGAIGRPESVDVHATWHGPWRVSARPASTAAEKRLRNWVSCDALSGGQFVERHVHAIDRALWVLGDRAPASAEPLPGAGGDAVAVRYRFDDGSDIRASSTRVERGHDAAREAVVGSRGSRDLRLASDGCRFQATMDEFLRAIRSASAMDDADILVRGSLVAIMGRLAAASGRVVGWDEMLAANASAYPVCHVDKGVNLHGV
ncbi:MAG: Gfo/Idh/MocA family oxidoreductase [Planctomycetia bacterium]